MMNSPIWASHARPSAKPRVAGRCGSGLLARISAETYVARNPLPCMTAAAPYAQTISDSTAMGYRPEAGSARRRSANAPTQPMISPATAPMASSATSSPAMPRALGMCSEVSATTRMITGASLKPDSASRIPDRREGSGRRRSTEKTAAASVGASTAPSRVAMRQSAPISQCAVAATTTMLTAVPTVASAIAAGTPARTSDQRVVMPPSARIRTSAARPSVSASQRIIELDAEPGLAEQQPQRQVEKEAGQPAAMRHPDRHDGRDDHDGAEQQPQIELHLPRPLP